MRMKVVKKSISLPEDLYKFVQERTAKLAKERGAVPNVSQYFSELIAREKREAKQSQKALAA
jgi:hypothetical protein